MLGGAGMITTTFSLEGDKALIRKLNRLNPEVVPAVTRAIAETLRGYLAKYPGPVKRPVQWASERQRRWYLGARRAAGLGPYVRQSDTWSERLGPSWATENRGQDAIVGTRVSYAPWVQNAEKQQPMHANTGWITDEQAIDRAQRENIAQKEWNQAAERWIRD
jgi:hypothetical protein